MTEFKLDLPARTFKPRENGISNLVDNGYGLSHLADILSFCGDYIDIVKLGWASAYITKNLNDKIKLFREHDIQVCLGGMMFEICFWQGKIPQYEDFMKRLGIDMVEVSNGSLPISEGDKVRMIEHFSGRGFTVLSEVGSKDVNVCAPSETWVACIKDDLEAGAWKVITEGRADASAGIYDSSGAIKSELIDDILESGVPVERLVFEAPHKRQMSWLIQRVGANVNIGNVPLDEVLNLETLRLGLRGDTVEFFHNKGGALHS